MRPRLLQELRNLFSPYRLVLTVIAAVLALASVLQDDRLVAAALLAAAFAVAILGLGYSLARRAAYISSLQAQLAGIHEHNKLVNQRLEALESRAGSAGSTNVTDRLDALQALLHRSVDHTLALNQSLDEMSVAQTPEVDLSDLTNKLNQLHGLMELSIDSIGAQRIDITDLRQRLIKLQLVSNTVNNLNEDGEADSDEGKGVVDSHGR